MKPVLLFLLAAMIPTISGADTDASDVTRANLLRSDAPEETRLQQVGTEQPRNLEETEMERPLLDFAVIGFPKTGTSFMESTGGVDAADHGAAWNGRRQLRQNKNKGGNDGNGEKKETTATLGEQYNTEASNDGDSNNSQQRPLLDFAVIGFPKTGTSFMEHYLFNTPETFIDKQENCFSYAEDGQKFIDKLITERHYPIGATRFTEDGYRVKNAVKCPKEMLGPYSLSNYERFFPEIKFVVSTRHPVWWFQSRYNYKLRQTYKHSGGTKIWAPTPSDLMGPCADGAYHYGMSGPDAELIPEDQRREPTSVCTDGAKFHHTLSRLGKTPLSTEHERELVGNHEMSVHSFPKAKIFLMEIGQFSIEDPVLANQLLQDMKDFLELEHDLPPLLEHESKKLVEEVAEHAINICDAEHDLLRAELVQTGRDAYKWIRDYFLESPDVVVSSRKHFLELIEMWQYDPCVEDALDML